MWGLGLRFMIGVYRVQKFTVWVQVWLCFALRSVGLVRVLKRPIWCSTNHPGFRAFRV